MLERKFAPSFNNSADIKIHEPEKIVLDNGIPLYLFNSGEQEVLKIEILFRAGSSEDKDFLKAGAVNEMLDEGTAHHTSAQIAEEFEYYGTYIEKSCTADWASLSLFTMNRFLKNVLPLFKEIITGPVFPEKELETYKTQNKQRLEVSNNKVDYLARKNFNQKLFGQNSAYGFYQSVQDYDLLDRNSLIEFHEKNYPENVFAIVVAGKADENSIRLLRNYFSSDIKPTTRNHFAREDFNTTTGKIFIPKTGAVQSGLRLGKILFNKTHPDYISMTIVNTLLGGYFGSRLMSNIREDKGFTYGIGSALVSMQKSGYFFITTEVGVNVKEAALKEIYYEIERLRNEPVDEDELNLVRNYLTGVFQRSIDGPFALAERFKSVLTYGLKPEYYNDYLKRVNAISTGDILEFSQRYFTPESFTEIVVG